jgi:hypothetical protein
MSNTKKNNTKDNCIDVTIEVTKDKIVIVDSTYRTLLNIDTPYVRSVLDLVASLIDDDIKNTLNRDYVKRDKNWKYKVECSLKEKDMLNGE